MPLEIVSDVLPLIPRLLRRRDVTDRPIRRTGSTERAISSTLEALFSQLVVFPTSRLTDPLVLRLRMSSGARVSRSVSSERGAERADVQLLVAILIGTGIGVTPFASILKNIW